MVRKLAAELKGFDNLYYEICNEPYFGGVTLDWQYHIANVLSVAEGALGVRHLISQNIANYKDKVENPDPLVSVFNFHYATPPDTVALNFGLNKVIGENETGFRGTNDAPYRMEAWDFIVAGGGLFNNLDYSFTAGYEDGTFVFPASQPGGGSPKLRGQLRFLSKVIRGFDFIHMRPDSDTVKANLPTGTSVRVLAKPDRQYLIYVRTGLGDKKNNAQVKDQFAQGELMLEVTLPPGHYKVEWLEPRNARSLLREQLSHSGGQARFNNPAFTEDVALSLRKL